MTDGYELPPEDRDEWVCCIQSPDDPYRSMCGYWVFSLFRFTDAQHAESTVKSGGRLEPCPDCARVAGLAPWRPPPESVGGAP